MRRHHQQGANELLPQVVRQRMKEVLVPRLIFSMFLRPNSSLFVSEKAAQATRLSDRDPHL